MPRAIVFDLFGVIASTQKPEDVARIELIAGVDAGPFWEAYWALRKPYDAGQSATDYWAAVAGRLDVRFDDATVRRLVEADMDSWTNMDPAMVELVGELAAGGRTLGLLSNIVADLVPIFEARHGAWLAHFKVLAYSCETGVAKPDREAYEIVAGRLGVEPQDCLFIDDNEANVLAAREAGMRAEVFRDPGQVRALLAV
ncbi:HAD family phosphatase [Actinoallomurus bryophytorum]|uniref:Putative hydrolase of the HAD superfamily n=1 Tax=Actinoallomurus bryophytorum TaxID=1490222 RepID=A0A543CDE7_9ACTN|nr:HAD family phosphatase [Actinoallomurus bryophytorum]TQL95121.1 putative hydrolase of the HAD superfamily [Actinoallomurus bryophytorum]